VIEQCDKPPAGFRHLGFLLKVWSHVHLWRRNREETALRRDASDEDQTQEGEAWELLVEPEKSKRS
jgi:hypothetical protein